MSKLDVQKIDALLRKDSLADLITLLVTDPCDDCDVKCTYTARQKDGCGFIEQEGLRVGANDARRELKRRQNVIANVLLVNR
jgi:hypothetical protein